MRAIWSAPPPGPAGIMNSTGLVGSQAANTGEKPTTPTVSAVDSKTLFNFSFMNAPPRIGMPYYFGFSIYTLIYAL